MVKYRDSRGSDDPWVSVDACLHDVEPIVQSGTSFNEPLRVDVVVEQFGGSSWFYGYVENMFDPLRFLVRADTWEDAYETLLLDPYVVECCRIEEVDVPDYYDSTLGDMGTWNEDGVWMDAESVMLHGPVRVQFVRKGHEHGF